MGGFRITIGGLMKAIVGAAVVSAVLAAVSRTNSGRIESRQLAILVGVMVLVVGVDTARLVRRARAGGPPYGPGWSPRAFAGGMGLVWACLGLPFLPFLVLTWEWRLLLWLPVMPVAAGLVVTWPLTWMISRDASFIWPEMMAGSTLLVGVLARLVARGWLFGACALALAVAVSSALLIFSLMMSV